MVLPGHIAKNYLQNIINENMQVQPAGIDLTVRHVFKIVTEGYVGFEERRMPKYEEVPLKNDVWKLKKGAYKVVINEIVYVPEDAVALCFPRSTLLRMGVDVRCALWDPGYYGRSEVLMIVHVDEVVIEKNARIAQLIFVKMASKPLKKYNGKYKGENI